jgi:hypothetical protein
MPKKTKKGYTKKEKMPSDMRRKYKRTGKVKKTK